MSSYTMELRTMIEQASQDTPNLSHRERIEIGRKHLFDFPYPIFDEDYRRVFETNFIRNFYTREIGFETEELFKFKLDTWLNINMPYYNKLFQSELIEFNPLESYSLKTTYQRKSDTKQNEDKTLTQSQTSNDSENETLTSEQSTTTNRQQNDDKTLKQNSETSLKDITESNETSESLVENEGDKESTISTNETESDFKRALQSDTPDSRLSITPNADGSGVIEYASKINEDKGNSETDTKSESSEKTIDTQTSEGTVDNVTEKNVQTTNENNENETLTTNENEEMTGHNSDSRNKTGSASQNLNASNKGVTNINDIEDYVEEKVGSIGVKTYSEMIQEYRSILLRIERDIFNEMNQLFMLVY